MDEIDRKIISLISRNPELSQSSISNYLEISQPAVSMRIKKLKNNGFLSQVMGLNLERTGLTLAKIDIKTKNTQEILDFSRTCPLCTTGLIVSGKYNICLFFVGEDMMSIEACINKHIRSNPVVLDMELNFIVAPTEEFVIPLPLKGEKKKDTPCGKQCKGCAYYAESKCLGCPDTTLYKGSLL